MRTNFAADFYPTRTRFAQQAAHSRCADMLAMNVMIAKFGQENVAHHDRFLARRGPARQSEQRAPVTFVNHSAADEIVILTMIEHRDAHHARVFDRAAHQFVILNAVAVIGDRDDAGLCERANRRQFFAREVF